jgi:regulatory protein
MKEPTGDRETKQKQTKRIMGALVRAGFSTTAIFKVLRAWNVELEETDLQVEEEEPAAEE